MPERFNEPKMCKSTIERRGVGAMADKTWKVYVHTNRLNGKRYVGIISKPKVEHRWNGGRGYHENPHFNAAINYYGWDAFDHEILYTFQSDVDAKEMEKRLIYEWHLNDPAFGYNMTTGGDGTPGFHPSEETRAKLSDARKKENLSAETLRRRSDGLRGRHFTESHKKKIGEANSKPIQMVVDGTVIRDFASAREAETTLGISHSHISQCCHGQRATAGGYGWRFAQ